jgi:hypothetical protein
MTKTYKKLKFKGFDTDFFKGASGFVGKAVLKNCQTAWPQNPSELLAKDFGKVAAWRRAGMWAGWRSLEFASTPRF